jgi:glycosyltransferase involved in cell wall biosynthesis
LRLVGANPPASIERLGTQPGVDVTGYVPDLLREYRQARVVVAPMQSEAGALNKVIDALAAGRPVVATAAANAGIEAPPEAVTLADDAPSLARAIAHLLADDEAATRQGIAARRFAKEAFDWPGAAAALEAALLEFVHAQRVRPTPPSRHTGSTARERG